MKNSTKTLLKISLGIVSVAVIFFIFQVFFNNPKIQYERISDYETQKLKIGEKVIDVEISDTDEKRVLGLSYRKSLKDDTGMLFVFESLGPHSFWMKGMNFPIDIIWFDGNRKIVHLEENISPKTFPETFGGQVDSKYILEVNAGFVGINGMKIGNEFEILEDI